jgi:hypothetical protein
MIFLLEFKLDSSLEQKQFDVAKRPSEQFTFINVRN